MTGRQGPRGLFGELSIGLVKNFEEGKWIETPVGPPLTNPGQLLLRIVNHNARSNAVVSILEWVEPK
ncbi:MAG TPA: hypothetical protein PK777_14115 [Thermoguttaceae bacterium]|nr:hypothetical protein [Thermoguttaceae bacterium]HPP54083.1 hypothetical protein [Thermoguttaceae bacterium]